MSYRGRGGGGSKKCRKSVTYYLNGPFTVNGLGVKRSNFKRWKQRVESFLLIKSKLFQIVQKVKTHVFQKIERVPKLLQLFISTYKVVSVAFDLQNNFGIVLIF
jgi:hypothetical protein